jgi:hypothetical protein
VGAPDHKQTKKKREMTGHKERCSATKRQETDLRPVKKVLRDQKKKKVAGDRPARAGRSDTGSTGPPRQFNRF